MKSLKELLTEYKLSKKAIPAFNIDTFEIYQAVEDVVRETGLPCIVQLSAGEDKFIQGERLFILVKKAQIDGLPIYLNMDHGKDLSRLETMINLGFDMVHFDASAMEYETNLEATKNFIENIKKNHPQVLIEAEFNKITLVDETISSNSFTDPTRALEFMTATKADLLAVSIGNQHGVSTNLPEKINLDLLQKIFDKIPENFITLHGGSGIGDAEISAAIKLGIVKININTDLRISFKQSLASNLISIDSEKIYEYLNPVIGDLKEIIRKKLELFSSSSHV